MRTLDLAAKGWPRSLWGTPIESIASSRLNVAKGDLPLPVLTISRNAVNHNIALMKQWCASHGARLAPHVKTSLAPELIRRQMEADAWGATVSNGRQARVAVVGGARRVLVANEVVDQSDLEHLFALMADDHVSVTLFVDSKDGLGILEAAAKRSGQLVDVLVEIGAPGGRTGVRDESALCRLLAAVDASPRANLAGISAFEGIVSRIADQGSAHPMRDFVWRVGDMVEAALHKGYVPATGLMSAGGSVGFDLVVERFESLNQTLVLRSGCYLTHDHGFYERVSPLRRRQQVAVPAAALQPALELWAHVISVPEAHLAIASFGKRDANEEADRPIPLAVVTAQGDRRPITGWTVDRLWDQHARLIRDPDEPSVKVGDVMTFGVSHPCTALDKWRYIPEIDASSNVLTAVETFF